jgi:hypothetical protein
MSIQVSCLRPAKEEVLGVPQTRAFGKAEILSDHLAVVLVRVRHFDVLVAVAVIEEPLTRVAKPLTQFVNCRDLEKVPGSVESICEP